MDVLRGCVGLPTARGLGGGCPRGSRDLAQGLKLGVRGGMPSLSLGTVGSEILASEQTDGPTLWRCM